MQCKIIRRPARIGVEPLISDLQMFEGHVVGGFPALKRFEPGDKVALEREQFHLHTRESDAGLIHVQRLDLLPQ